MDYARRLRAASAELERRHIDTLFISHLPNVRYLCGFTGSSAVLAVRPGGATFFTDGRYTSQAREEVRGARVIIPRDPLLAAAMQWARSCGMKSIGIEAEHITVAQRSTLKKAAPRGVKLREMVGVIEELRKVKDADELRLIRDSVNLGASLLEVAVASLRPGVRETEIAAEMEYAARTRGAEAMSFETIIASGKRSALPHGRASSAPIPRRGFVVLDFGVILHGYCSDMTRTVWVGKSSRSDRDLYEAVREAQESAVDAVRAGVTCGEVDHAARSVLRRARLDRFFTHSIGHGVGLEIHEAPRLARGQRDVLRPGMVITVEPGAYLPGRGGVRIEDMVVVGERGCERLTPAPKTWLEL